MEDYKELKKLLKTELDKIARKNELNINDLESATKIACLIEKLYKIEEMEMTDYDGYSERGYSRTIPSHYVPRVPGSANNSYDYFRDHEYSGDPIKYHTVNRLKMMWEESKDPHEKAVISEAIEKLER